MTAATPAKTASPSSTAGVTGADSVAAAPVDQAKQQQAAAQQPIKLEMAAVPVHPDFKLRAGYRPLSRGLHTVYCTSITPIG